MNLLFIIFIFDDIFEEKYNTLNIIYRKITQLSEIT